MFTPDNLYVYPLDMARMERDFNAERQAAGDPKRYLVQSRPLAAAWTDAAVLVTDPECCGFGWARGSAADRFAVVYFYEDLGPNRWAMVPAFGWRLDEKEIEAYTIDAPKPLKDHMGARFDYNSRIRSNTAGMLRLAESGV